MQIYFDKEYHEYKNIQASIEKDVHQNVNF
jgi:hypothetical protein